MSNINNSWVVVQDPDGKFWPGAIVDAARANQLRPRGVTLLPVVPALFKLSGVGGYAKREWGSGWPMDETVPRMHSPLTMYCTTELTNFHWAARLVAAPEHGPGAKFQGTLRFAADPGQPLAMKVGLTPDPARPSIDVCKLGPPDVHNGWTIGGTATARVPGDGHYGFAIFGTAPGLRIAWAAISLANYSENR